MTFTSSDGKTNLTDADLVGLNGAMLRALNPPPPPPVVDQLVPLLASGTHTMQFNWQPDYIRQSVLQAAIVGARKPWRIFYGGGSCIAKPLDGKTMPARLRVLPFHGNQGGLYEQLPRGDGTQRYQQIGDDIAAIAQALKDDPPKEGARGTCEPSPYGVTIWHPFLRDDGTEIPGRVLKIRALHDGTLWKILRDGSSWRMGQLPGCTQLYDAHTSEVSATRLLIAVADYSNRRVVVYDRTAAVKANPQNEDPALYSMITVQSGMKAPTGVKLAPDTTVYAADNGAGITKDGQMFAALPTAFALDHDPVADVLVVHGTDSSLRFVDCKTGAVGSNMMPTLYQTLATPISIDYWTVRFIPPSCLPLANGRRWFVATRVHKGSGAQKNAWLFRPDGILECMLGPAVGSIFDTSRGNASAGDLLQVSELLHYAWDGSASPYEALMEFDGYGNHPAGHLVALFATKAEGGPAEETDYNYLYQARGIDVLRKGGPDAAPFNRPSLTCQMNVRGWGPIVNCDVLADWSTAAGAPDFDRVRAWIQAGGYGSFPRPDIVGVDLYSLMLHLYRSSQRYLETGAPLMAQLKAWWIATFGPVPAAPLYGSSKFAFPVVENNVTKAYEVRNGKTVEVWEYTGGATGAATAYGVLTNPGLPAGATAARTVYLPDAPGQRVRATL